MEQLVSERRRKFLKPILIFTRVICFVAIIVCNVMTAKALAPKFPFLVAKIKEALTQSSTDPLAMAARERARQSGTKRTKGSQGEVLLYGKKVINPDEPSQKRDPYGYVKGGKAAPVKQETDVKGGEASNSSPTSRTAVGGKSLWDKNQLGKASFSGQEESGGAGDSASGLGGGAPSAEKIRQLASAGQMAMGIGSGGATGGSKGAMARGKQAAASKGKISSKQTGDAWGGLKGAAARGRGATYQSEGQMAQGKAASAYEGLARTDKIGNVETGSAGGFGDSDLGDTSISNPFGNVGTNTPDLKGPETQISHPYTAQVNLIKKLLLGAAAIGLILAATAFWKHQWWTGHPVIWWGAWLTGLAMAGFAMKMIMDIGSQDSALAESIAGKLQWPGGGMLAAFGVLAADVFGGAGVSAIGGVLGMLGLGLAGAGGYLLSNNSEFDAQCNEDKSCNPMAAQLSRAVSKEYAFVSQSLLRGIFLFRHSREGGNPVWTPAKPALVETGAGVTMEVTDV